ncbi:unnamed protein product, partial [Discosporangium mesarthrocarpum]
RPAVVFPRSHKEGGRAQPSGKGGCLHLPQAPTASPHYPDIPLQALLDSGPVVKEQPHGTNKA